MGATSSYESEEENEDLDYSDNTNGDSEEDIVPINIEAPVYKLKYKAYGYIEVKKDTPKEKEVHWNIPNLLSIPTSGYIHAPVFTYLNVRWYLRIDPKDGRHMSDYVALNLVMAKVELAFNMLCTFGIKRSDGSLVGTVKMKHMFCNQNLKITADRFYPRDAFWVDLGTVPLRKFIIVCNLKELPQPTNLTELNLLSEDIESLFTDEKFCDIILRVKDKAFKAHRAILATRSPVFANYFKNEMTDEQNDVVDIPDCDPDSFPEFLEYLYSGKLENISFRDAVNLYRTANKYDVGALKLFCAEHMEQNLDMEYFFDVLFLTELNNETNLFNAVQAFFNRNLNKIFVTPEWENLMKNNSNLANKLLTKMSSDIQVVSKRRRVK